MFLTWKYIYWLLHFLQKRRFEYLIKKKISITIKSKENQKNIKTKRLFLYYMIQPYYIKNMRLKQNFYKNNIPFKWKNTFLFTTICGII